MSVRSIAASVAVGDMPAMQVLSPERISATNGLNY